MLILSLIHILKINFSSVGPCPIGHWCYHNQTLRPNQKYVWTTLPLPKNFELFLILRQASGWWPKRTFMTTSVSNRPRPNTPEINHLNNNDYDGHDNVHSGKLLLIFTTFRQFYITVIIISVCKYIYIYCLLYTSRCV